MDWITVKNAIIHVIKDDDDFKDVTWGQLILVAGVLPLTIGLIQLFTTGLEPLLFVMPTLALSFFWMLCKDKSWFKKKF